jgi:hypothetical protein
MDNKQKYYRQRKRPRGKNKITLYFASFFPEMGVNLVLKTWGTRDRRDSFMPCIEPSGWSIVRVCHLFSNWKSAAILSPLPKAQPPGIAQAQIKQILIRCNQLEQAIWRVPRQHRPPKGQHGRTFRNLSGKKDRGVRPHDGFTLFFEVSICENHRS